MDTNEPYVPHPRYGTQPIFTGLNPDPLDKNIFLHWNATTSGEIRRRFEQLTGEQWPFGDHASYVREVKRIPNTAIPANLARQTAATVAVTHYFDLERRCVDCGKRFIFFAQEQKHWYEDLGFALHSDCVRCVPCRKREQGLGIKRERYEHLFHVHPRTTNENMEMAECCLALIEASVFTPRQNQHIRMLLNAIPPERDPATESQFRSLLSRLLTIENKVKK